MYISYVWIYIDIYEYIWIYNEGIKHITNIYPIV